MYGSNVPTNPMFGDNVDIESLVPLDKSIDSIKMKTFLRKVYLTINYQLLITIGMCYLAMKNENIRNYVTTHNGPLIIGTVFSFVFLFMLFCYQKVYPINFFILTGFTVSISYTVAVTCALYVETGNEDIVIKSFLITILTFISLTIYTLQSKYNFDFLQELVFGAINVLIFWGFINWIIGSDGGIGYSLLGIFTFVCAIIFDTHRLKEEYQDDDYILAACNLYLDVINLFLYILDFLKKVDN